MSNFFKEDGSIYTPFVLRSITLSDSWIKFVLCELYIWTK
jgi:hypothetical protein